MSSSMRVFAIGCCATLYAGTVNDAYAYVDPAAGSYLYQLVIAGLMTMLFMCSRFRHGISALFGRMTKFSETPPEAGAR